MRSPIMKIPLRLAPCDRLKVLAKPNKLLDITVPSAPRSAMPNPVIRFREPGEIAKVYGVAAAIWAVGAPAGTGPGL